jgi:hypothetical protein
MSNWYTSWLAARIRHEEVQREAVRRRLVWEALSGRPKRLALPGRVLLTLGCWLVERGWRLQHKATEADVFQWGHVEIRQRHPVGSRHH